MSQKTAFVTGASGFIGVNLVKELVATGWDVTALHRRSSNLDYLSRLDARRVVGDITDAASLEVAMPEGVDAVYHVAGNVSFDAASDVAQNRDNIDGTVNMITCAVSRGGDFFGRGNYYICIN